MNFIQGLGIVAGICTSSSLIPQLVKTIKSKAASEVSTFMFIVLMSGNALWIYYGIEKNDMPIIITNAFSMLLNIAMLILKYRYTSTPDHQ
ncbi:SemiSWEET family sugar transporter [Dyadobacter tibetensis]|uniref:SemiSWEET family sugar transporter n=1 Tax=Dyadobacter tibetensis TaxID=1211851 RepID=UPI00046F5EB8|nr:SemiSWEET transporter [Dyadobacter tibetensis]